jgi:putative hemolysin
MTDPDECSILILGTFGLILFLLLSAFFSGSETALFSLDKFKLKKLEKEEHKPQIKSILTLLSDPRKTLITILIGNMFVNISASSLATFLSVKILGNIGVGIASIFMIIVIIIFGEVVPKSLAISEAEKFSKKIAKPIEIISYILFPLIKFFEIIMNILCFSTGIKKDKQYKEITEEDLLALVNISKDEEVIKKREKDMLMNIFEFRETTVKEIMVPRVDIICESSEAQLKSILKVIKKSGNSRIPIYEGTIDNIIGILYVKDLLRIYKKLLKSNNFTINDVIRKPYFVPENKKIVELLITLPVNKTPSLFIS